MESVNTSRISYIYIFKIFNNQISKSSNNKIVYGTKKLCYEKSIHSHDRISYRVNKIILINIENVLRFSIDALR